MICPSAMFGTQIFDVWSAVFSKILSRDLQVGNLHIEFSSERLFSKREIQQGFHMATLGQWVLPSPPKHVFAGWP